MGYIHSETLSNNKELKLLPCTLLQENLTSLDHPWTICFWTLFALCKAIKSEMEKLSRSKTIGTLTIQGPCSLVKISDDRNACSLLTPTKHSQNEETKAVVYNQSRCKVWHLWKAINHSNEHFTVSAYSQTVYANSRSSTCPGRLLLALAKALQIKRIIHDESCLSPLKLTCECLERA